MPRFSRSDRSRDAAHEPATVFEAVYEVIRRVGPDDMISLHLGDTHTLPPGPARPGELDQVNRSDFGRYCDTKGIPELRDLLVKKVQEKNGMQWVEPQSVQVTCGAIHGLYAAVHALVERGEEVITFSPHWHLANGVISQAGGVPRDMDFYIPLSEPQNCEVNSLLCNAINDKTTAIYINTPCNPTGMVLDHAVLEQVSEFAKANDLWVISDEAYEDFIFTGGKHISMANLPGMQDRTVTLFTFSKCMAAAGYRVGYAVGHPEVMARIHRASTRTVYNAPTDNQHLVAQALLTWDDWFPGLYNRYKRNRDLLCERFQGRFLQPDGGFYCFFDARDLLKDREPESLLEEMVRHGVAAVPGRAFGKGYEDWFRLCFVAVPEERLAEGIDRLNRVFG